MGQEERRTSARTLDEIIDAVEKDGTLVAQEAKSEAATQDGASTADGGMMGTLLSNPELMSKLPTLLRVVRMLNEGIDPKLEQHPKRPPTPEALLCALRPYLGDHRRQAVDTMIRITKLSDSLRSLR